MMRGCSPRSFSSSSSRLSQGLLSKVVLKSSHLLQDLANAPVEELETRTRELEEIPELELTTNAVVTMNQKTIDDIDRWLLSQNPSDLEEEVKRLQIAHLKAFAMPHHQMQQKYSGRYCERCAATLPKNDHLYCRICSSAEVSRSSYYHYLADRMSEGW